MQIQRFYQLGIIDHDIIEYILRVLYKVHFIYGDHYVRNIE